MSLERSSFLPISPKPIPLLATPSAGSPAPWDAAGGGGRAQPHLRGCPYNRAGAELRAGQPAPGSTAAALPGEPGRPARLARCLSAAGTARPCLPPGSCPQPLQTSPAWLGLREMFTLLRAGSADEREPPNASPGKASRGLWEGAEHPREELCLNVREDRLHRGASCPGRMLCSPPARSSVVSSRTFCPHQQFVRKTLALLDSPHTGGWRPALLSQQFGQLSFACGKQLN